MDHDDFYIEAYDDLEYELKRDPTPEEVVKRAQELMQNAMANAYDRAKDLMKYGE